MFKEYSKGTSLKMIKSVLENNGVRTRREKVFWSMGSLQVILRNETYLGFDQFKDKKTNLTIKNSILQIISNKLWGEVQERKKVKLMRKGQINRTTNFYLFRDFLMCSCGTPMGGRIKKKRGVRHYYCPLSERKFNNSYKDGIECSMKRCMNITTTDKILWKKIVEVLSNTNELKKWMKGKSLNGKNVKSKEIEEHIRQEEEKISELTKSKNDLEKGLVKIETEHILNKYPSESVYDSLKKELTKRYHKTKSEIEDLRNSLQQISNDEQWYEWLEEFGKQIQGNQDIPDTLKKDLLKVIIDKILVEWDKDEELHILTIHFKIPVVLWDGNEGRAATRLIVKPCKRGRKQRNQIEPFRDYSTVTDLARFRG